MRSLLFYSILLVFSLESVYSIQGDLNKDGKVDFSDFFILADNFGKSGEPEVDCGETGTGSEIKTREEARKELGALNVQYSEDALYDAVDNDDDYVVNLFLQAGFDANESDLLYESITGRSTKVGLLLLKNESISFHQADLKEYLFLSVGRGESEIALVILDKLDGVDIEVNKDHGSGQTFLSVAAITQDSVLVNIFIEKGADIFATTETRDRMLVYGVEKNNFSLVRRTLDAGADPNMPYLMETALNSNIWPGGWHMVRELVFAGGRVGGAGGPFMLDAVSEGDTTLIDLLIIAEVDINYYDNSRKNPLMIAVWSNQISIVSKLISAGADVNWTIPRNYSSTDEGVSFDFYGSDRRFYRGTTPLMLAAFRNNAVIVRLLLNTGANVNDMDDRGHTALYMIKNFQGESSDYSEVIQILTDAGGTE